MKTLQSNPVTDTPSEPRAFPASDLQRYLVRKAREIALLDASLETSLALDPPRSVDEVIDYKFKLAGALRAERSLMSWAITETARPEPAQWQCGAFRMSFGYQRADLEVRGPPLYPALEPRRDHAVETLYTGAGMSAIAALLTALVHLRGEIDVQAPRGGYGETRELLERFGRRVRVVPLRRRATAEAPKAARIVLVDSVAGAIPGASDPMPRGTELVVFDTTCFGQGSGRIRRVARWARRHDVPLAMVRSHAKLDCLGIEYGRLGSIVLAWRRKAGGLPRALVRETRNAVRLLGVAPIPAHLPPFAGSDEYADVSAARTAALIRNTRRLFRRLRQSWLRNGVAIYPHGLYVTLAPRAELRVSDVKRAVAALCATLAAQGLPARHAGSFGFDFIAVEWFPDPVSRRNVIRIAPGDVPAPMIDRLADGIAQWFALQTAGATPDPEETRRLP